MDVYCRNLDVPELGISSSKISSCQKVAEFLLKNNIMCQVTDSHSVVEDIKNKQLIIKRRRGELGVL